MSRWNITSFLVIVFNLFLNIGIVTSIYTHADFIKDIKAKSNNPNVEPWDEYSIQMENAALMGIPRCLQCLNISIVGAGVAGLTAAVELSLAGHNVIIYEASARTGGRVLTYRHPTGGYMTELGAMRLPLDVHTLLKTYVQQRFNLPTAAFYNEDDNTIVYLNNVHATTVDANIKPNVFQFKVNDDEQNKTPADLWNEATEPLLDYLRQEGPEMFADKYASFSVDQYLNSINMSRAAIDYIGLMLGIETNLHLAITESIYDMNILRSGTNFYHIKDGNDRLIDSLRQTCLNIPDQRCSLVYNARVTNLTYFTQETPKNVQLTFMTSSSQSIISPKYDKVIIATTATAANMLEFSDASLFVDKYRALRQVHYDCATKVALFFNQKWWYSAYTIRGGRSSTDLPVRASYFHNFNVSATSTDGAAILGSYVWAQDSIVWQSLSNETALQQALNNINRIYAKVDVYQSFVDGITKHWCNDPYSHGAFVLFTPFQERDIKQALQQSVGAEVLFIGEHTSSAHGWIEGAIMSALRGVLTIHEESFDVVIVGGGPIGLLTAIRLASRRSDVKIAIIEQFQIGNQNGGSHENVKQFRQPHSELYLSELAKMSVDFWRQLEQDANLTVNSILNLKDGLLIIGDTTTNVTTVEGNFNTIGQNCIQLNMGCEFLSHEDMQSRFQLFHFPPTYRGIFHQQSGYINVTELMTALVNIIDINYSNNIVIREQEEFLYLDQTIADIPGGEVRLLTNRGSLRTNKIVYVPGPYAKNISDILGFNLQMTMWELPDLYFALRRPDVSVTLPTWFSIGASVQALFNGYPIEASDKPGYVKISPEFIRYMDQPLIYPKDRQGTSDNLIKYFIEQAQEWIDLNAPAVDPSKFEFGPNTCLATFVPDNGFIIDYLPTDVKYRDKILLSASGWAMKFAPIFADILVDFILDTTSTSNYTKYIPEFSLSIQNRVIPYPSSTTPVSTTLSPDNPDSSGKTVIILSIVIGVLFVGIIGGILYQRRRRRIQDGLL